MNTKLGFLLLLFSSLACAQTLQNSPQTPDLLQGVASRSAMRLEEFERLALATSPSLQQATALISQSAAQARQAGLYPNPSVGYQGEQIRGGSYHGGEQGAFVQQTFVLGGKLGLRRNVYEQQRRAAELTGSEQRYRVLSDVSQSFYSALAAQESSNVRERLLHLALDAVTTARQLANVGQADAPDLLQAEVEAEQAQLDRTAAQRDFLQAFHVLAALAGKPDLTVTPLAGDLEHPPQFDAEQIVRQLSTDSPAVKRARQEVARAEAELKSAKRELIPDLTIHAGVQQSFEPLNASGKAVGVQAFTTASISLPIFNRNQGNIAAAHASIEQAQAEISREQLVIRQTAEPLLQAYLVNQLRAARYRDEMMPRAARAYQLYLAKYQNMAAAYPQVLISQRTYFQLQIEYIGALQNVWSNAILLQNFTLSSGTSAPASSVSFGSSLNSPTSSSGGQ